MGIASARAAKARDGAVLLLQPFDAFAGAQRVGATLIESLRREGWSVEVALGFGRRGFVSAMGARAFLGIESPRWRKWLYPLWLIVASLRAVVAVLGGKAVWANVVHAAPATLLALLLRPSRVALHIHEAGFPAILRWFVRWAARRGATLVFVSDFQRAHLQLPGLVLPNAVGETPPDSRSPRRHIVFVGTTKPLKGMTLLIDVAHRLAGCDVAATAYLAGPERDEDAAIVAAARAAGIAVHFEVTDPACFYGEAALAFLPGDPARATETFSLVAAEAVWHLVPVISAGMAVLKETCGSALAFDAPDRDPVRLAAGICALLDDEVRYRMLVEACRVERDRFTLAAYRRAAGTIVERLLDRSGSTAEWSPP